MSYPHCVTFEIEFNKQSIRTAEHLEKVILGFGDESFAFVFGAGGASRHDLGYMSNAKEIICYVKEKEDPHGFPALLLSVNGPLETGRLETGEKQFSKNKIYVRSVGIPTQIFLDRLHEKDRSACLELTMTETPEVGGETSVLLRVIADCLNLEYLTGPLPFIRDIENMQFESRLPFTFSWGDPESITINAPTFTMSRLDHEGKFLWPDITDRSIKTLMGSSFITGYVNNHKEVKPSLAQQGNWPVMFRLEFADVDKTTVKVIVADTGEKICMTPVSSILFLRDATTPL